MTVAIGLSMWNLIAALIAVGLVLAYAIGTRNDRKRQLLYAYIQGHRQFKAGDFEAALANFTDMEEADFAPPAVLRAVGLTNYQLGRWAEAATYLEDVPKRTADESVALAHALIELEEAREAAAVLDALESLPAQGVVVRAVSDLRAGKSADAAARLLSFLSDAGGRDAPSEEPYLAARYWLGEALEASGRTAEAKEVFACLRDLDPTYQDVAARL
jgi:tetratricopeptide (TPR) repeat protein